MAYSDEPPRALPQPVGTGEPIDPGKLKELMAERGLSRLALANEVERVAVEQDIRSPHGYLVTCSRDAVSKWLKGGPGGRRPKISTMVALCIALNCNRKDLLYADAVYGPSASAVAGALAESADPVTDLTGIISSRIMAELKLRGYLTLSALAEADADGKLTEVSGITDSPLDVIRRSLARNAGFRNGDEET